MTLEESQARDQPQAKDVKKYQSMVEFLSGAASQESMNDRALVFLFDLSYERADIALALHTVEIARGWH